MLNLAERIHDAVRSKDSRIVLGLDPHPQLMPRPRLGQVEGRSQSPLAWVSRYLHEVIDAASGSIVGVKLQSAFFEVYGPDGLSVYRELATYSLRRNLIVIADAKRGEYPRGSEEHDEPVLGFRSHNDLLLRHHRLIKAKFEVFLND